MRSKFNSYKNLKKNNSWKFFLPSYRIDVSEKILAPLHGGKGVKKKNIHPLHKEVRSGAALSYMEMDVDVAAAATKVMASDAAVPVTKNVEVATEDVEVATEDLEVATEDVEVATEDVEVATEDVEDATTTDRPIDIEHNLKKDGRSSICSTNCSVCNLPRCGDCKPCKGNQHRRCIQRY